MTASASTSRYVGCDIGGTFTDAVLVDLESGDIWTAKVLTTERPGLGALESIRSVLEKAGLEHADIARLMHGTTLVSNALIERKGAKVGLITTAGFADVIEIGREIRFDSYNLGAEFPEPPVSRRMRREVKERVLVDGTELEPLDCEAVHHILGDWRHESVEAIAVSFLHSYRNPGHEDQVGQIISTEFGGAIPFSLSSEVAAEFREYERTSTTVLNAYVQPIIGPYQRMMEDTLRSRGYDGPLYVMLSSGGIATSTVAAKFPVRLLESGPAAGVLAGAHYSDLLREPNLVSFDVGGTTAKACLIHDGAPARTNAFEVARTNRFMKGSGLPVRSPSIDMIEIGAGGGSLASVDELGFLRVGPESAGSIPGPACYGLGGTEPTVTDANLLLGYLAAESFAGGELRLDVESARHAVKQIADRQGISLTDAAWSVFEFASENMASAVRVHLAEQGHDPRNCSLFATGGGGPLHGSHVAAKLRMNRVICPLRAGVMSAFGLLTAPLAFDFVQTYITRLDRIDWAVVRGIYEHMERTGRQMLLDAGVPEHEVSLTRDADMRRLGQMHEITVALPCTDLAAGSEHEVETSFDDACTRLYGAPLEGTAIEILTWRLSASGLRPVLSVGHTPSGGRMTKGERAVYFREFGVVQTTIYDRYALPSGFSASGPALVEERESTAVVRPGDEFTIDDSGTLLIDLSYDTMTRPAPGSNVYAHTV